MPAPYPSLPTVGGLPLDVNGNAGIPDSVGGAAPQHGFANITRLAPSPTGALHLGNARTFLVNWALARRLGWQIVLRIEDLDTPRVKPGVISLTIELLTWLGIDWDHGPFIQSLDRASHVLAMEQLAAKRCIFPCDLSRKEIDAAASAPQEQSVRGGGTEGEVGAGTPNEGENRFSSALRPSVLPATFVDGASSWRFLVADEIITFKDLFAGAQQHRPAATIGDFVVWTKRGPDKPGQAAYQLAVVVDDARSGVTHIVRGDDLLDSAARQLLLYRALELQSTPSYIHLPLVRGADGRRLAKRHGDSRLDTYRSKGVQPQRIIGLIAAWCGVVPHPVEMDAAEFQRRISLDIIPRSAVVLTPELEAWLLSR